MAFTVRDFHDLVKLLREHPEWREELRALLLAPELLSLPQLIRELAEKVDRLAAAQARTEERVAELAAAQARTEARLSLLEERMAELAAAQARTEERLGLLEERVAELTAAQARTEERLSLLEERMAELAAAQARAEERLSLLEERMAELAAAQARTEERLGLFEQRVERALEELATRVSALAEAQARTELSVGELKGIVLELRWRERAPAYLGKLLRRARLLSDTELLDLLDTEQAQAVLSAEERDDLLQADFVVVGKRKPDGAEVYLVGEVSFVVDPGDVERARRRAELLGRLGVSALPVVAGHAITREAERLARSHQVPRILDGTLFLD